MKTGKRVLAIILALVMVALSVPVAFAQGETQSPISVDNGEMEVKATSTFGSIISRAVKEKADASGDDYRVTALDFSGKTAAVQYKAAGTCMLVVAIYNEETQQMLASATDELEPGSDTTTLLFDVDSMPIYFMAKAFLLDAGGSALCNEFITMQYTKAFKEEFKDVTVEDFAGQDVINLDDSNITNFAVMAEEAELITSDGSENVFKSDFLEDETYVFENIDDTIRSLQPGDIFHYDNGDETQVIVIKVKSITINGTTAVIVADETSVDEVFEYVKIDESDEQYEMHFTPNYDGEATKKNAPKKAFEIDKEDEIICDKISYEFGKNGEGWQISESVKVTGSVSFECGGHVKFYYERHGFLWLEKYFEIELSVEPTFEFNVTITAEMKDKKVKELGEVDIYVCPGLYIAFTPAVVFKASVSLSIGFTAKAKYGFQYNSENDKWINTSEPWSAEPEIKLEGKFFFGLDMSPSVALIHKKVAEAGLTAEAGLEISASISFLEGASDDHTCKQCLDGDINMVVELSAYIKLINGKIKNEFTLWKRNFKILDFYYSFTYRKFGFGECPYIVSEKYFNGHVYKIYEHSMSWKDAKQYCEDLGGHLATITSAEENAFIYRCIKDNPKTYFWLGGTDEEKEGVWKWVTGETWSFSDWCSPYQPDNYDGKEHYLELSLLRAKNDAGAWNDLDNEAEYDNIIDVIGFICEWESPTTQAKAPAKIEEVRVAAGAGTYQKTDAGAFQYTATGCVAGQDYILLNVTGYGNNFRLTTGNLEYIDQVTADESGAVSGAFLPRQAVAGSTTLLIGDFGSGTAAVILTEETQPADHTPGDINGDGVVNNKDLNRLMKKLAGENVDCVEAALDVNGDGVVNNKDLNRLMKHLAGENVVIV